MLVAVIILEFGIMIYIQVKHETLDVDIHTNLNHTFMQSVNDEKYLTSYHNVQEDVRTIYFEQLSIDQKIEIVDSKLCYSNIFHNYIFLAVQMLRCEYSK